MGVDGDVLDLGLYYQRILRVRIGWYALPDASPAVVAAVRAGGRLACVSALEWHEGREPSDPLHIVLNRASRARAVDPEIVIHWSRRADDQSVAVVSVELARRQAERCQRNAPNLREP
jgi:hypothetical protein